MNCAAMAISPDDRRRLISVLTLLSSNHDGERSAAGAAATRMLQRMNTTWEELITSDEPRQQPRPREQAQPRHPDIGWRTRVWQCLQSHTLTAWERNFLLTIKTRGRFTLTARQIEILNEICAKVGVP